MSESRTVVWSSLYRFSADAALEIISLFEATLEGKESSCTFDEAADTFQIECGVENEKACREKIHAIIAEYIESHTGQETALKVERIKETRLSDVPSEGDDETAAAGEADDTLPEGFANFEFLRTWRAVEGNQGLTSTYFNGVYLVEEIARGTFCATWADFSKGTITIGGDDYLAVMKIFAKLENIEKHYLRNKRRPEIHLVEVEGEDRQSVQLRFFHLVNIEKKTGMARTTLMAQVPMQQYPFLSVARLLRYDRDLDKFYLPKMQLKPVRELDKESRHRAWAGYLFKHRGQVHTILGREAPASPLLPPAETIFETVQKWVDSNSMHQDHRSLELSATIVSRSNIVSQSGSGSGDSEPPTVTKPAGVSDSRRPGRFGLVRRLRVRPQTHISQLAPDVPEINELSNSNDSRVELPTSALAVVEDAIGQHTLMDMTDHHGTMNSLIQPLLPDPLEVVLSPPPEVSSEAPIESIPEDQNTPHEFVIATVAENPGERCGALTHIEERLQEIGEVETREFRRTMGQQKELMADSTIRVNGSRFDSNFRRLSDGAKVALENAFGFVGLVELKMKIGRILIKDIPNDLMQTRISLAQWEAFPFSGISPESVTETIFTDFLMTSSAEEQYIVDLEIDGQRLFGERPYMSSIHYELLCVDKENAAYTIYIDGETFEWDVKELQMVFGHIYRHYPIRPNKEQLQITFKCAPDNVFRVPRVMLRRETRYVTHPKELKIALCITEMQRLRLSESTVSPGVYNALADTHAEMVSNNRLWYGVSLISQEIETLVKENLDIEVGEEPSWSPEEIVDSGIIERLESVSNKVIRVIDNVGFSNQSPHWLHFLEQERLRSEKDTPEGTRRGRARAQRLDNRELWGDDLGCLGDLDLFGGLGDIACAPAPI
ncbi:hypothetical protein FGG08_000822 [Glutinoglossum americanum]|uniref:DUF7905 domain-containing protein n=1 Tax=Glutinoglossum americanum TaxID=1670608 RepID=A0A9P8L3D6_9PEZI|nr:hypothetical protein FGG08_000822 [Glutinoglossum americanum]